MDKNRVDEILKKIKEFIKQHKGIERAIVFGSVARGDAGKYSDVDIILVSKEFEGKSALKRPVAFYLEWRIGRPVDFLCYTPEEFNSLKKKATIVREAVNEGIEIPA